MEVLLRKGWDSQIAAPHHDNDTQVKDKQKNETPSEECFIGRVKEIELLKNDILQKEQGSILVAGHRGVGKTSFVYKVLNLVKNENENKILFVYINAGQLDNNGTGEPGQITTETILKTLIRRLYATARGFFVNETDLQASLEQLYKKAVAKEFKLEEQVLNTNTSTDSKISTVERKVSVEAKIADFLPAVLFAIGFGMYIFKPATADIIYKIVSFVFALPLLISYTATVTRKRSTEKQEQVKAEEIYQVDNNIGNLEYDLEEFHRKVQSGKNKIIYVIDELDKLSVEQEKKVLRYLKNLFTLSKAIFIFISNEDIFEKATAESVIEETEPAKKNSNPDPPGIDPIPEINRKFRPEYYTFFTSKYFISRPTTDELKRYFYTRTEPLIDEKEILNQRAAHYFAFESKGDFFNIVNTIKDNIIKYNETNVPVVDIIVNNPILIKKSRLHRSFSTVFFQRYYLKNVSRMRENELLYRDLIDYMYKLADDNSPVNIEDPEDDKRSSSAIRDINRFLFNNGFLTRVSEKSVPIKGVNVSVSNYSITGSFTSDPPDKMETMSEEEKRLETLTDQFLELFLPVFNAVRIANGESKMTMAELCRDIRANLEKGIPGVDLTYTSRWIEAYYYIDSNLSLPNFDAQIIDTSINELNDYIGRIKSSGYTIFRNLVLAWCANNGLTEPSSPRKFNPVNTFRNILQSNKIEWTNYFYLATDPESPKWAFLFGRYLPGLENVLDQLKDNKEFTSSVVLYIFQTSNDEVEKLRQFFSTEGKIGAFFDIQYIDVSDPVKLPDEMEKIIKSFQSEISVKKSERNSSNDEAAASDNVEK